MERVRVLIMQMPRVLADILEALIQSQEDMELVGEVADRNAFNQAVARQQPDVVLLGCDQAEIESLGQPLLEQCPSLRLLALAGVGEAAYLYELCPRLIPMGALSPDALLNVIRTAEAPLQ